MDTKLTQLLLIIFERYIWSYLFEQSKLAVLQIQYNAKQMWMEAIACNDDAYQFMSSFATSL